MVAISAHAPADGRRVRTSAWSIVGAIAVPPIVVPGLDDELLWWHGEMVSILLLVVALGAARRWQVLHALRAFVIVWIAYLVASVALWALLDAVGYIAWTERTPKYRWATISVLLIGVPAVAMLGAAFALGNTRGQLNLARGDTRARGQVPWGSRDASWTRLGWCTVAIIVVGGSIWIWSAANDPSNDPRFGLVLIWLVPGLAFAAVNAAQEELRFRLVPLTTLGVAVGDEQAIWMTSTVFGLAHWSGATPAGPLGAIFNTLVGAWFAKSILETRGVTWAWAMHATSNLVLFIVLVLTA